MKDLKVKNYDLSFRGLNVHPVNTIHVIEYCLDLVPPGGITPGIIKNAVRIQEALDKAREELKQHPDKTISIHLEDSDVENLKGFVERSRWGQRNTEILDFINEIEGL